MLSLEMVKHQEDSLLVTRNRPKVGLLGKGWKICRVVENMGIGGCDIAQASGRRSRLDCKSLIEHAYNVQRMRDQRECRKSNPSSQRQEGSKV